VTSAPTATTLDSLLHLRAQELCHAVGVSAVKRVVDLPHAV